MKAKKTQDVQLDFLVSALSQGNFVSTADILAWMKRQNDEVVSSIKQIPIEELNGWIYTDDHIRQVFQY